MIVDRCMHSVLFNGLRRVVLHVATPGSAWHAAMVCPVLRRIRDRVLRCVRWVDRRLDFLFLIFSPAIM